MTQKIADFFGVIHNHPLEFFIIYSCGFFAGMMVTFFIYLIAKHKVVGTGLEKSNIEYGNFPRENNRTWE